MTKLIKLDNLADILSGNTPLIDIRSPLEFAKGAIPNAINLPLLTDEQRAQIGICYKDKGQDAAIDLGQLLISKDIKNKLIKQWQTFCDVHPNGALYCFRGGMRSQFVQTWLYQQAGICYPRIKGGYKAMRRFLIDEINHISNTIIPVVITGKTGAGKTKLLKQFCNSVDLEKLANHRGSAFGKKIDRQPTQINFENQLALRLMQTKYYDQVLFEDESHNIGKIIIPPALFERNQQANLVLLDTPLETRIKSSLNVFVTDMRQEFIKKYGFDLGNATFLQYFSDSLKKIKKRLGGLQYTKIAKAIQSAHRLQISHNDDCGFASIIERLLVDYYDPMYQYQIEKKRHRIVFSGEYDALLQYLKTKPT